METKISNSLNMEFCHIQNGYFMMGSNIIESEQPAHLTTISKSFYLGKHTVTQQQFKEIMGYNPAYTKGEQLPQLDMLAAFEKDRNYFNLATKPKQPEFILDLPVEQVSWNEANKFCQLLSKKENRTYRLPTEAEWEYSCRAGSMREFYWGNEMEKDYCHYATITTIRSGHRGSNPWGLCDMLGNVFEWCGDWFAQYIDQHLIDPIGPDSGTTKVYRGGSYDIDIDLNCRCASRFSSDTETRFKDVGFRVLLEES